MQNQKIDFYKFLIQAAFSTLILCFCIYQLSLNQKGRRINESLYSSILSGIIGYWLPSPTSRRTEGDGGFSVDGGGETTIINNPREK